MINANDFRSSIRRHGTSNRKFSYSNRFILQTNSPACTTDAVLRKYGETSERCTSFGPYFNNGIQNPFYIELAQAENYYGERLPNQASLPLRFTGGEDATNILTIIFRIKVSYSTMLSNKEPLYISSSLNSYNLRRLVFFSSTTSRVLYSIRSKEFLF